MMKRGSIVIWNRSNSKDYGVTGIVVSSSVHEDYVSVRWFDGHPVTRKPFDRHEEIATPDTWLSKFLLSLYKGDLIEAD